MMQVIITIVEDDEGMTSKGEVVSDKPTDREKELTESIVKQATDIIDKYHRGLGEAGIVKETTVFTRDL